MHQEPLSRGGPEYPPASRGGVTVNRALAYAAALDGVD